MDYGTEYSDIVERDLSLFKLRELVDIPKSNKWRIEEKSFFIESIILKIPTPPLFAYKTGIRKWKLVDGNKRVSTLDQFVSNYFCLENLEILQLLNGLTFSELERRCQRRIEEIEFKIFVLGLSLSEKTRLDIIKRIKK